MPTNRSQPPLPGENNSDSSAQPPSETAASEPITFLGEPKPYGDGWYEYDLSHLPPIPLTVPQPGLLDDGGRAAGSEELGGPGRSKASAAQPKKKISQKQLDANRANGKKGRGPKTQEGKDRSRLNALGPGTWATLVEPITSGAFAEDPEEFNARVASLSASFPQRDAAEEAAVRQIVMEFVRLVRTDGLEAAVLCADAHFEPEELVQIGDPLEVERQVQAVTFVMNTFDALTGIEGPDDWTEGEEPAWDRAALHLRALSPDPAVGVGGLWDRETTPRSEDEWRLAARSLFEHHWGDPHLFATYLNRLSKELADELARRRARLDNISARRQLQNITALVDRPRNHAWRRLREAIEVYRRLHERDLDE